MNKRRLFGGLRGRMVGLVVLAVLPGFIVGALNAVSMMTQAQEAARASLMSALERITQASETEVKHAAADMVAVTRQMPGGEIACSEALVAFARHNPRYLDVGVVDSDGRFVCDLPRPGVARTPVDRKLVQLALRTPARPTSALISVQGSQLPRLVVFHVLPSAGGAVGRVAYTSIEFSRAFKLATDPIAKEARVVVIDIEGHGSELKTEAGHHLKPLSASELSSLDVDGRLAPAAGPSIVRAGASLIGMIPLGTAGGPDGIMLDISREDLYRGAWLELRLSITVMIFALLFILLLLLWASERLIMQPASLLTHAADRLALGDLGTRTGLPPGNDEFSRVAMAFDRMAENIQQRTEENALHLRTLRRTSQLQSVLATLNAAIFHRESPAQLLDTVCKSLCETGGFHLAWVGEADSGTGLVNPVSWAGPGSAVLAGMLVSLDDSVAEGRGPTAASARGDVVSVSNRFIEDASTAAWHALAPQLGIGSALALPMGVTPEGRRRVLTVYAREADYFVVDEIQLIEQVAHDAAFGLHLMATEQVLAHASSHDSVTGLPNHLLLKERLGDAIWRARSSQKKVVVSVLEVGFQQVVSQWGSQQGHALFKQTGETIEASLSAMDMVGVLTGARFAIIMSDIEELDTAEWRIASLVDRLRALQVPATHGSITPMVKVGVSIFPDDGGGHEDLIDQALEVLTQAEQEGDESIRFFAPAISCALQENRILAQELHDAIGRNELILHYQPIVILETGALRGFEALLRWMHPTRGEISPERFIPLAESSGLISAIGEWVVEQAARQAAAWTRLGVTGLSITINVSAIQLRDIHFAGRIRRLLESVGMRSTAVSLAMEVTESQLIVDVEKSIALLNELKAMGIAIIIDDFGTGYSSLSYLHRLPLDVLKIDKSFTKNIDTSPQDQKMVAGILALAQSLGLETVAEGIERVEQLQVVKRMGFTYGQGFFYDRGLPVGELQRTWLRALITQP
jgi:diguanylate cyclase (GGDEF)-like protein